MCARRMGRYKGLLTEEKMAMRLLKYRPTKLALTAFRNRLELIKAGLTRRDLLKMGLLTSAGYLVAKSGLSSRSVYGKDGGSGSGNSGRGGGGGGRRGGGGGGGDGGGAALASPP